MRPPAEMKLDSSLPRPFVFINMAMTADGKISTVNRAISSFGSKRDFKHLYELRATADAVMCGARTVDLNPVTLGPGGGTFMKRRVKNGLSPSNLRIVVTGTGSVNPSAEIFKHRFSPIILLTTRACHDDRRRSLRPLADELHDGGDSEIMWIETLHWLRARWGVNRLLCEGGGALNAALFQAGVVDELHLTICPTIAGGRNAPSIAYGPGLPALEEASRMKITSAKRVGAEMFLTLSMDRSLGSPSSCPPAPDHSKIS